MSTETLTPAETANLWNSYLTNTMGVWVTRYFLNNVQDQDIHKMLTFTEELALYEVTQSKAFFEDAGYPLPEPFDQQDVDVNRLMLEDIG